MSFVSTVFRLSSGFVKRSRERDGERKTEEGGREGEREKGRKKEKERVLEGRGKRKRDRERETRWEANKRKRGDPSGFVKSRSLAFNAYEISRMRDLSRYP